MRKTLLAGNWKMHKTRAETRAFLTSFFKEKAPFWPSAKEKVDLLLAVPFLSLGDAKELAEAQGARIAAQNVHQEKQGAFTGEISIPMLQEIGINDVLVGHSERRQYFGETNEIAAKKALNALAAGMHPIFCVGETRAEREGNRTEAVLAAQLEPLLKEKADFSDLVIAYEPVWAIGTGLNATKEQAQAAHAFIRGVLRERLGDQADKIRILYGGSVKPDNFDELIGQPDIDGGLVGGASLKPEDFAALLKIAQNAG